MSIGRLQAALAAATNEVTVAAANINFEFTLVKCEAPKEYEELGNALSKRRKDQAESGSPHITARRLGALFKGVCPRTPALVRAYGTRASEIAESAKNKFGRDAQGSIFVEHAGVDGTSIWAAATSSDTALQVHLLACMLARFWSGPEATSAWFELVNERKKAIAKQFESGEELPFATLTAAAQAEISRISLAEWDASVRSWLRTADAMKEWEQKQLMLILANVNVSVSEDMRVLTSIIEAWKLALVSMEKLIGGMAQSTNSGPTLLALSSWHLYPDVLVVGSTTQDVRFRDDSIVQAGGVLTIGLKDTQIREEGSGGLHWSLSLAHLRHYGRPVKAQRQLTQDSRRIKFPQFAQAVLGSILANWNMTESTDYELAARIFVSTQTAIQRERSPRPRRRAQPGVCITDSSHPWSVLGNAAWDLLDRSAGGYNSTSQLVKLGARRSSDFMPGMIGEPLFNFGSPNVFLNCLKGPDERLIYLRRLCSANHLFSGSNFIKYRKFSSSSAKFETQIATALPMDLPESSSLLKEHGMKGFHLYLPSSEANQLRPRKSRSGKEHMEWIRADSRSPEKGMPVLYVKETNKQLQVYGPDPNLRTYKLAYGDKTLAGIWHIDGPDHAYKVSPEYILDALEAGDFSTEEIMKQIESYSDSSAQVSRIWAAISAIATVYKLLPDATISVNVLNRPIAETKWTSKILSSGSIRDIVSKEIAMSCVAYMDSGSLDIEPSLLTNVMALSSGDSLYISMMLACDPWERPHPFELKHVLGNVGRPGITMLVAPENTMVRDLDPSSWKVIKNDAFNLGAEDHFKKTTMHLNFTDYYVPVFDHVRGEQDMESFFLESFISVYDSGAWVGDVDISTLQQTLRSSSRTSLFWIPNIPCRDPTKHATEGEGFGQNLNHLISAESWDEIFDPPRGSLVVRANQNWIARLAVAAIVMQTARDKSQVVVCPNGFCWRCASNDPEMEEFYFSKNGFIFIF